MKIYEFDPVRIAELLSYFPRDMILNGIDFRNNNINFDVEIDVKAIMKAKEEETARKFAQNYQRWVQEQDRILAENLARENGYTAISVNGRKKALKGKS